MVSGSAADVGTAAAVSPRCSAAVDHSNAAEACTSRSVCCAFLFLAKF